MRKNTFRVLFGVLFLLSSESVVCQSWVNFVRFVNGYDETGNMTSSLFQSWQGDEWINENLTESIYSTESNLIEKNRRFWENGAWTPGYLHLYTYLSDTLIESTTQYWQDGFWNNLIKEVNIYSVARQLDTLYKFAGSDSTWRLSNREIFHYDNENKIDSSFLQFWIDTSFVNHDKYKYEYDSNGNQVQLHTFSWDDDQNWLNNRLWVSEYDSVQHLIHELAQRWLDDEWTNFSQRFFPEYDGDLLIEYYDQRWEEESWVSWQRIIRTYNENSDESHMLAQNWDYDGWVDLFQNISTYDESGNLTELLQQNWMPGVNIDEENQLLTAFSVTNIFPNPFNSEITIEFAINSDMPVYINIYDCLGRSIYSKSLESNGQTHNEFIWNGTNQSGENMETGIYIVKLNNMSTSISKKILLLK